MNNIFDERYLIMNNFKISIISTIMISIITMIIFLIIYSNIKSSEEPQGTFVFYKGVVCI